jgi:hypothetical protein
VKKLPKEIGQLTERNDQNKERSYEESENNLKEV